MTNNQEKPSGWGVLWYCVVMPGVWAVAIALAASLTLGCREDRNPPKWLGLDRWRASCANDDEAYPHHQATCVVDARAYKCVTEDGDVWRCAELGTPRAMVERGGPL